MYADGRVCADEKVNAGGSWTVGGYARLKKMKGSQVAFERVTEGSKTVVTVKGGSEVVVVED